MEIWKVLKIFTALCVCNQFTIMIKSIVCTLFPLCTLHTLHFDFHKCRYMAHINSTICEFYEVLQCTVMTRISERFVKSLLLQTFGHDCNYNIFLQKVENWYFKNGKYHRVFSLKNGCSTETPKWVFVKPKCVCDPVVNFWKIVNKQLNTVTKFLENWKNNHLSNTFWLYQHLVKYAPF